MKTSHACTLVLLSIVLAASPSAADAQDVSFADAMKKAIQKEEQEAAAADAREEQRSEAAAEAAKKQQEKEQEQEAAAAAERKRAEQEAAAKAAKKEEEQEAAAAAEKKKAAKENNGIEEISGIVVGLCFVAFLAYRNRKLLMGKDDETPRIGKDDLYMNRGVQERLLATEEGATQSYPSKCEQKESDIIGSDEGWKSFCGKKTLLVLLMLFIVAGFIGVNGQHLRVTLPYVSPPTTTTAPPPSFWDRIKDPF